MTTLRKLKELIEAKEKEFREADRKLGFLYIDGGGYNDAYEQHRGVCWRLYREVNELKMKYKKREEGMINRLLDIKIAHPNRNYEQDNRGKHDGKV